MTKLEQRCSGVKKVLDDFGIMFVYEFDDKRFIKICKTKYNIEISNRYIKITYTKGHYVHFLTGFTGITEFKEFIKENGTNFMKLKEEYNE